MQSKKFKTIYWYYILITILLKNKNNKKKMNNVNISARFYFLRNRHNKTLIYNSVVLPKTI